ncbi:MAG: tetratricopeptide repeat protein [Planctomycetales bacterium]
MNPRLFVIPALVILPAAVFAQTARFQFVDFDDGEYVYANARVVGGLTGENVRWAFTTTHAGKWMPLTWLSFMLDAEFAGRPSRVAYPENAAYAGAFHVTNVVLHVANGLLLFAALRALSGAWWTSALAAALFAVHPLRVESVAWVTERKDVLSAFFGLLAMWGYAGYVRAPGLGRYAIVAACFALSLLAKEMLVTLPFVLLLLDYWPLHRFAGHRTEDSGGPPPLAPLPTVHRPLSTLFLEKLPLLGLAAASSVVGFLAHRAGGAVASLDAIPLPLRLANALWSYLFYLGKTLWPFRLAAFYPHPGDSLGLPIIAASAGFLLIVTALAVWIARRGPWLAVGWFWFLGTLVPVIGIVQVGPQGMADRFTYFPLIGLFVAAAWTARTAAGSSRLRQAAIGAVCGALVAALAVVAWRQTAHWRDGEALFAHAIEVTDCNAAAHVKLAGYHRRRGETGFEIRHLRQALECEPDNSMAHMNLGIAYARQGPSRRNEALAQLRAAVSRRPPDFRPYFNLGQFLAMDEARLPEAEFYFRAALERRPRSIEAWRPDGPMVWTALGEVLARQERPAEAAECFERALQLDPEFERPREHLRELHEGANKGAEARSAGGLYGGAGVVLGGFFGKFQNGRRNSVEFPRDGGYNQRSIISAWGFLPRSRSHFDQSLIRVSRQLNS